MKFRQNFKVIFHDTDTNGIIYPTRLFMFLQEAAHGHTDLFDCAPEVMIKRDKCCFWLTRICVSILEDIHAGDELTVETFASSDSRGFSFNRCFEVFRGEKKVCQAYSVWALMDLIDMRPRAVKDWDVDLGTEEPIKPSAPIHARIPKDCAMAESGNFRVYYRDTDHNGHVNNTRYPDIICGFLPSEALDGKRVSEISISYLHEAALGESLTGFCAPSSDEENVFYVRTVRGSDDLTNIEAKIKLSDVKQ